MVDEAERIFKYCVLSAFVGFGGETGEDEDLREKREEKWLLWWCVLGFVVVFN